MIGSFLSGPTLSMESVSFEAGGARIISDIDLAFKPGELAAVIGPSGSGKSTLLKCLTTTHRPTGGAVLLDGRDLWRIRREYRVRLGYVPQDDVIHRRLTVERAFLYSARLRLDTRTGEGAVRRRIDSITRALGLEERKHARIFRLSGGQRKRVNIGIELLADPEVLILDEPASGLDPGTEEDLVSLLHALAKEGRTVVTTTHSMEQLAGIDKIVLLMRGRVIFTGPAERLLDHFQVPHAADVFKTIRRNDVDYWVSRYRSSRRGGD